MLRNILMFLGLLVAFLPYAGFPYDWNRFVWTTAGLLIFFLVFFSRKRVATSLPLREVFHMQNGTRSLHVERREVEDRPEVHIETETTLDSTPVSGVTQVETITSTKTTKRKPRNPISRMFGVTPAEEVIHD